MRMNMRRRREFKFFACGLLCLAGLAAAPMLNDKDHNQDKDKPDLPREGVAVLVPTHGNDVGGILTFTEMGESVHIKGKLWHLQPGKHGFHIHQFGDLRDAKGMSAGGHFNPHGESHGGIDTSKRHAGDLGNIEADKDGVARVDMKAKLKLHFIVGRSIVVHEKADDLKSDPAGDSGSRLAFGVIGIAQPEKESK